MREVADEQSSQNEDAFVIWKVGDPVPDELAVASDSASFSQPVFSTLLPRTVAWLTVDDEYVTLLEGYTASCYTPPALHFAASALPKEIVTKLLQSKVCSLSAATLRDPNEALQKASCRFGEFPKACSVHGLGLKFSRLKENFPPTIIHSPIKMHCSLEHFVPFDEDEAMIVLIVENFVVDGSVLSSPTESMIQRNITAKIDAELVQPIVGVGNGKFSQMSAMKSMPRPVQDKNSNQWTSTDLLPLPTQPQRPVSGFPQMEWNFREDGSSCPLGFNPTTALIMPRPIGWISTYSKEGKILHLAPYSFFVDVARGERPKVAFSAFRKGGSVLKDAHKDAEETRYFCFNMVTEELAVHMNYSAAELTREESEFELAGLTAAQARLVEAPIVKDAKITYECEFLKTIELGSFSIVIGEVKLVSVHRSVLTDKAVDPKKLSLIARLGYMDEYSLF